MASYLRSYIESEICNGLYVSAARRVYGPSTAVGLRGSLPASSLCPPTRPAGVSDVPFELRRQFSMMRELDEKSCRLQQQVDADVLLQLKAAAERQSGKPGSCCNVGSFWYAFSHCRSRQLQ